MADITTTDQVYTVKCICDRCGTTLNETHEMDEKTLRHEWIFIAMGSALASGRCPQCNYSTLSDLNIGTTLAIYEGERRLSKDEKRTFLRGEQ